jgi:hypothetical protein
MGDQVDEMVSIAFDLEIETPPPVDSGLPDVAGLIELLCSEGRTAEILEREGDAAVNGVLDSRGRIRVALEEALGVGGVHQRFLSLLVSRRRERIACRAVENGP